MMDGWLGFTSGGFLGIVGTTLFGIEQTTSFFVLILFLATMFFVLFSRDKLRVTEDSGSA